MYCVFLRILRIQCANLSKQSIVSNELSSWTSRLQPATSWQMYNQGQNSINLASITFNLAAVDNSANQYTGTWAAGGPVLNGWNSGPSTCINNAQPCVANAQATAFTQQNFGPGVTLWCGSALILNELMHSACVLTRPKCNPFARVSPSCARASFDRRAAAGAIQVGSNWVRRQSDRQPAEPGQQADLGV